MTSTLLDKSFAFPFNGCNYLFKIGKIPQTQKKINGNLKRDLCVFGIRDFVIDPLINKTKLQFKFFI